MKPKNKRMLPYIIAALFIVIGIVIAVAASRPDDFRVTRSATIAAPPAAVFSQVNEIKKWEAWSPWQKMDPGMKQTYEGPAAGVGASQAWAGNSKVGEGKMTIIESKPDELVKFRLEFLKPFAATNTAEFTFKAQGNQTLVTWTMDGKNNFMFKLMGLFMDCDKMIGGDFERGLAQLKTVVETAK
jgi:hypothetical protein